MKKSAVPGSAARKSAPSGPRQRGKRASTKAKAEQDQPALQQKPAPKAPAIAEGHIAVQVKFMGDLPAVIGQRAIQLSLPAENSVGDLLAHLSETYGEAFTSRVFSSPGKLHHYILIFVDGKKIQGPAGFAQKLGGGQVEIVMMQMFGGG